METNTMFKQMEKEVAPALNATPVIIVRLDGKNFSSFTREMRAKDGPFSPLFTEAMIETTRYMAQNVPSCALAYTQSDEISLALRISPEPNSQHWVGGKLEKIVSLTAAMASAKFATFAQWDSLPLFDSRAFNIADDETLISDYFKERQSSGIRNAIGMLAYDNFSNKALVGVGTRDRVQMLADKGIHINDGGIPLECKMGVSFRRYKREMEVSYVDRRTGETQTTTALRSYWEKIVADRESFLLSESE